MQPPAKFLFFILSLYFHFGSPATLKGCQIDPFKARSPLLVHHQTTNLIYPENNNKISLTAGEIVEITCLREGILADEKQLASPTTVSCIDKETLLINGNITSWNQISCSSNLKPDVSEIKYDELPEDSPMLNCNEPNLKIIKIRFKLTSVRFMDVIDICFDTKMKLARYSFSNLVPNIEDRAKRVTSPGFKQDESFYKLSKSIKQLYKNNQTAINRIVKLDDKSTKYVNKTFFLNRGHLSPKANFFYEAQQKATYRYINAAPQWNTFNGGNWNTMETDLRNYVSKNGALLQIWTGTYGTSTLPNEYTGDQEKLYLYVDDYDESNSPSLPVPEVFWKLVYDPVNRKGIVLVGHNNPYEEINNRAQKICDRDVSKSISWLNWKQENLAKGYSYACRTDDNRFLSLVTNIPKFVGIDLLN